MDWQTILLKGLGLVWLFVACIYTLRGILYPMYAKVHVMSYLATIVSTMWLINQYVRMDTDTTSLIASIFFALLWIPYWICSRVQIRSDDVKINMRLFNNHPTINNRRDM